MRGPVPTVTTIIEGLIYIYNSDHVYLNCYIVLEERLGTEYEILITTA